MRTILSGNMQTSNLASSGQPLPPGHPSLAGQHQQVMGPRQPGPVELSNFWNALSALNGGMGPPNQ